MCGGIPPLPHTSAWRCASLSNNATLVLASRPLQKIVFFTAIRRSSSATVALVSSWMSVKIVNVGRVY
jgi:hypothetical protein